MIQVGYNLINKKKFTVNIGITHAFSRINICRVPRKVFDHEADRPSAQISPEGPANVNAMKQTCVIIILAYFTLFPIKFALKMMLNH